MLGHYYTQKKSESQKNKVRNDLVIYKSRELESAFIEIIMPRNKNVIVGFIYRHPNIQRNEINNCFLFKLSTKLSKEPKEDILLLRDFNNGLLKSDENSDLANFLLIMFSISFLPQITSPTRIRPRSRTLIGNISSKDPADNLIAGNIVTSISVHLARFLILPNRKFQKVTKTAVYQINFTKMNKKSFWMI